MKRILITATVSEFVPKFEMHNIKLLHEMGCEVWFAANFCEHDSELYKQRIASLGMKTRQIDYERSPFCLRKNIQAYRQLKKLCNETEFDLIHCHTPVAAVIARLVARKHRKKGLRIIYTAHGFHFFKGASPVNWALYYPTEWLLARMTDQLNVINEEDYTRVKKITKNTETKVAKINGVGIDTNYWRGPIDPEERAMLRNKARAERNIEDERIALVSVGELISRKNHKAVIAALARIKRKHNNSGLLPFRYFICGQGKIREELQEFIRKEQMDQEVVLLGQQDNILEILLMTDVFLLPSKQEGLPVALMEAVTAGVPVIASDIRGNRDIVNNLFLQGEQKQRGYLFRSETELEQLLERILLGEDIFFRQGFADMQEYDTSVVQGKMKAIYSELLGE